MKIFVDADGCPVVDRAIRIAKENNIKIVIVKNYAHEINSSYAEIVTVDISHDSADYYIVNRISKGDIVVTQDYGLATMCLSRGAIPINQNGLIISEDNIDGMLNRRHLNQKLRRQGIYNSKFKKRNPLADMEFEKNLKKIIFEIKN